jgi:hypothetical protein
MLSREVLDAVDAGKFHILAVATIEEGIEILSGVAAGSLDEAGAFPVESVFGRAAARLEAMRLAAEAKSGDENGKKHLPGDSRNAENGDVGDDESTR